MMEGEHRAISPAYPGRMFVNTTTMIRQKIRLDCIAPLDRITQKP
jgi:hypothetical protein